MQGLLHPSINHERIFSGVTGSKNFEKRKVLAGGDIHTAFAQTAFKLAEAQTYDDGKRSHTGNQLHVSSKISSFVTAVTELRASKSNKNHDATSAKNKSYVKDTVEFNHAVSGMLKANPRATYGEVKRFLMGMYDNLYPKADETTRETIQNSFEEHLKGVVNEIVGEQLASFLGYPVEDTTVEDDMNGVDRYLYICEKWYGVDFKSSKFNADIAREKHPENFTLSTGVPDEVIGGSLRLSPEDVAHYAPFFQKELEREINRQASVVQ